MTQGTPIPWVTALWKITKGSLVVGRGSKFETLYLLYVSTVKDHVICVTKQPSVSLWHCRLGHMSQNAMKVLSCSGYCAWLQLFQIFLFVNIVCMASKQKPPHIER